MSMTGYRAVALGVTAVLAIGATVACTNSPPTNGSELLESPSGGEPLRSPLEGLYYILQGGVSDSDSQERKQAEVISAISGCMKDLGFDLLESDTAELTGQDRPALDPSDRDSVASFGYGFTTIPERQAAPNLGYPEDWSQQQIAAYQDALHGPEGNGGCIEVASQRVFAERDALLNDERYANLLDEVSNLWRTVDADPKVIALNSSWSHCMGDQGYPGLENPGQAGSFVLDSISDSTPDGYIEYRGERYSRQDFEIQVALADFDCRATLGYARAYTSVRIAHEAKIAERLSADIEQLVTEYSQ